MSTQSNPLIGITSAVEVNPKYKIERLSAYEKNVRALESAGALPVIIPCTVSDETLRAIFERLDGVLLPGGGDIDSKYWGEELHQSVYDLDPARDHAEIKLSQWAVERDVPLFGICRGHQLFNVAMGGSLVQDIGSSYETDIEHAYFYPNPRDLMAHRVNVDANTRLAEILGTSQLEVNSIHHQAIGRLGEGLQVVATSPDGVIEGVEMPDKRFVVTVQWHPEDLQNDEKMRNLYASFVKAAQRQL